MARVLIVDDERSLRLPLAAFLRGAGYETYQAEDAEEALRLLGEQPVDVVVTDILMPRVDGVQLLQQVRGQWPRVQVILMTGEPELKSAAAAVRARAFDYLAKPVLKEQFLAVVGRAAEAKRQEDENERLREENRQYRERLEHMVEQRAAELHRSRRMLADAERLAHLGSWEWDVRTGKVEWSREVFRIFGLDPERFQPDVGSIAERFHPDDRHVIEEVLAHAEVSADDYTFETRIVRPDGSERRLVATVGRQVDTDGALLRLFGAVQDVTAQHRAERALEAARQEWEDIFQAIGHPAMILDVDHGIVHANRATLEAAGMALEEIRGRPCCDVFHGSDAPPDDCPLEEMRRSRRLEVRDMEMEALGRTYLVSCTPVPDADGRLRRVIHIATDITARKKAEEALRESRRDLLEAQRLTCLGSWRWDLGTDTAQVTEEIARIFDLPPGTTAITTAQALDRIHCEDHDGLRRALDRALKGEQDYDVEYRVVLPDGTERVVRGLGHVERDAAGAPVAVRGTCQEITGQDRTRSDAAGE